MHFASRLAITAVLMLGTAPVLAADLGVHSRIDAVSVYPDGATVTRLVEFEAPAGETVLVADDLPAGLDPASIRVDLKDAAGVSLAGIDTVIVYPDTPQPDEADDKALRELQDKRESLAGVGRALQAKQALIGRFAASASFDIGKEGSNLAGLRGAWNAVGDDMIEVNEAIRQNGLKIRDVDQEIAAAQARRGEQPQSRQRMQLRLSITSEQAVKGKIAVSYLIGNAGWTPLYDARLDSAGGTLEIIRRAKITQATGEDWNNVSLTVSTAHATAGAAAPKLQSLVLNFLPDYDLSAAKQPMSDAIARDEKKNAEALPAPAAAAPPPPRPGRETEANLATTGFQSIWTLPIRASVASGNASKSLRLASSSLTPDIVARAVPSLQQTAFLEASFNNGDDTPLLPGAVSVYRDGLYAGQTDMPLATRGEPVRLGFGADDRIKVERVVTRKVEANTGTSRPTTSEQRSYKISLRNGRSAPIKISVEEALPVAENKDIRIEPSPQMTPATTKDADNRRGVLVWTVDLAPGATKDINFGYKVTWPGDELINLD